MPDPRKPDPRFPNRPTHEDFAILAEIAQAHDAMAEQLGLHPFRDVLQVDEESFIYFAENRLGIFRQVTPGGAALPGSAAGRAGMVALFMDAFALGKAYAERKAEEGEANSTSAAS